eukprot:scaffold30339_cov32-Tisochrysis_lutea.AAC.3
MMNVSAGYFGSAGRLLDHVLITHVEYTTVSVRSRWAGDHEANEDLAIRGLSLRVLCAFLLCAKWLVTFLRLLVVPHQEHGHTRGLRELELILHVLAPTDKIATTTGSLRTPQAGAAEVTQRGQQYRRLGQSRFSQHDDAKLAQLVWQKSGRAEHDSGALLQPVLALLVHCVALHLPILDVWRRV